MKPIEDKETFITLRAQGGSLRKAATALKISTATASKWDAELSERIAERRADELDALYTAYAMQKEARIKRLGETLNKIETAAAAIDYTAIPPEKLLDMKLKYAAALRAEYIPPTRNAPTFEGSRVDIADDKANAILDIWQRLRNGDVTETQAAKEADLIKTAAATKHNATYEAVGFGL